jgi:hypothetical protein
VRISPLFKGTPRAVPDTYKKHGETLPRVSLRGHSGKRISKKQIPSPSVALGEEVLKNEKRFRRH